MDFISVWHWVSVGNLIGLIYIHTMLSKDIDRLQRKILKLEMKLNNESDSTGYSFCSDKTHQPATEKPCINTLYQSSC